MAELIFADTVPKTPKFYNSNEDSYVVRKNQERYGVFDGASEGYSSKLWSREIARSWIKYGPHAEFLNLALDEYENQISKTELSWSQEIAKENGSFTTFLGIQIDASMLSGHIIGDSCLFLADHTKLLYSNPYSSEEEFSQPPTCLGTRLDLRDANIDLFEESFFKLDLKNFYARYIILATDALSLWLIEGNNQEVNSNLQQLLNISYDTKSKELFKNMILEERYKNKLKTDDSTVIVLEV